MTFKFSLKLYLNTFFFSTLTCCCDIINQCIDFQTRQDDFLCIIS